MLPKGLTFLKITTTREHSVPPLFKSQHFILHFPSHTTQPECICMHFPGKHDSSHITHTCNQVFKILGQRQQAQNYNFQPTDTLQHIHRILLLILQM